LEPVTFHYKHELDPDGIPQFGLVAEKVARVDPNLVVRDEEGKPYSVRYEAVNAMLLNEFLKEHRRVEQQAAAMTEMKSSAAKQDATAARLESMLEQQQGEIAALTSQLRSMKTGFETSKASSPLVARNP
jgi:septal ring factor EnvC (AmiA/AmiB activator)